MARLGCSPPRYGPWGARCRVLGCELRRQGHSLRAIEVLLGESDALIPAAFRAAANLPIVDLGGRSFSKGIRVTLASTPAG
jgi:hypothetical protein